MHHVYVKIIGGIAGILLFGNIIYELHSGRLIEGPSPPPAPVPERRFVLPVCFLDDSQTCNLISGTFLLENTHIWDRNDEGLPFITLPDHLEGQSIPKNFFRKLRDIFERLSSWNIRGQPIAMCAGPLMILGISAWTLSSKTTLRTVKYGSIVPSNQHVAQIEAVRAAEDGASLAAEVIEKLQQEEITIVQSGSNDNHCEDDQNADLSKSSLEGPSNVVIQEDPSDPVEFQQRDIQQREEGTTQQIKFTYELKAVLDDLRTLKELSREVKIRQSETLRNANDLRQRTTAKLQELENSKLNPLVKICQLKEFRESADAKLLEYEGFVRSTDTKIHKRDDLKQKITSEVGRLCEFIKHNAITITRVDDSEQKKTASPEWKIEGQGSGSFQSKGGVLDGPARPSEEVSDIEEVAERLSKKLRMWLPVDTETDIVPAPTPATPSASAETSIKSTVATPSNPSAPSAPSTSASVSSAVIQPITTDASPSVPNPPTTDETSTDRPKPSPLLRHKMFQPEEQPLFERLKDVAQKRSLQTSGPKSNFKTTTSRQRSKKPQDPAIEPPGSVQEYVSEWHYLMTSLRES